MTVSPHKELTCPTRAGGQVQHYGWTDQGQTVTADQAPPQSKAEMQALSELPGIQTDTLPGSLGLDEEYGAEVGAIALAHFQR